MPSNLFTIETLGSLISLSALETVLGIDNVIFLSILVGKLPRDQQASARKLGLFLALAMRIGLLITLSWLAHFTTPLFTVFSKDISGRDLVLIIGGGFLIFKSTWEMFSGLEGDDQTNAGPSSEVIRRRAFVLVLFQIAVMDIVFSLDSVITAVGIAPHLAVMIAAMILSMLVMLLFAKSIGDFVEKHPSMKVLALSFLILIGTLLVAEGGGQKINKGYIYAAMVFAFAVELLNLWLRRRAVSAVELHGPARMSHPLAAPESVRSVPELKAIVAEQRAKIEKLELELAQKKS